MTDDLTDRLHQTTMLARSLRGAPLTVLFVMLMLRRSLGVQDLAAITGYTRKTVSTAMEALGSMGLVQQTARYQGWQLTDKGYQLPLIGSSDEGQILPFPCSSSFKNGRVYTRIHAKKETTTTNSSEGYFLLLPPEVQPLVTLLTDECGAPAEQARQAIEEALPTSNPAQLQVEIKRWLAYCLSEHGRGINTPGLFIASRIAAGQYCPAWFKNGELAQPQSCLHCGQPTTHTFLGEPICEACTAGGGDKNES